MDVVSHCPLRVASLPWRPRPGAHALTVICKATFDLRPGESPLAPFQEPPWDTPSVTDMAPFKRRADVFAVGHAYPPQRSQKSVKARLLVGSLDKSAEIRAEQGWLLVEGFGPLPPTAPSRLALLGEHAATWNHWMWNASALPGNIDGGYFNAAPADQQLPEITGDERIVLEHLHPAHPYLETHLARVAPHATVERPNAGLHEIRLRCDTLCIDTIRRIAMLVWRGVVLLESASEQGRIIVTAGAVRPNEEIAPDPAALLSMTTTLPPISAAVRPVIPFVPGLASPPPTSDVAPRRAPTRPDDAIYTTIPLSNAGPTTAPKPATPFEKAATPSTEPELDTSPQQPAGHDDAPGAPPLIEKPPMVGPLVIPRGPSENAAGKAASEPIAREQAPRVEPEPPIVELTIERYAGIKAELAETHSTRAHILASHALREQDWQHNDAHWKSAVDDETPLGEGGLRERYDAAYVAQVEVFRGPITADEYARITVALERGKVKRTLEDLKIQRDALMPIVRLWTKRIAKDGKLGEAVAEAIRSARRAKV